MKQLMMVLTFLLVPVIAFAAGPLKFGGGPHIGFSFSSFPDVVKDYYGTGFGFGAHGDMEIMKYVGVRLNVDYHMFGASTDKLAQLIAQQNNVNPSDVKVDGLSAKVLGITVNGLGKIPTTSPVTPYGLFGFGIHNISVSDANVTYRGQPAGNVKVDMGETKFGINFGAGAEFGVTKLVTLFFDFKYVIVFTSDNSTKHMPLTVGATFGL